MIYLASPYSHESPFIREERYLRAAQATIYLLTTKRWVYSPIVHCHELAKIGVLPGDFSFWKEYNFAMIACCDIFMLLRIEGWQESKGVAAEKVEAERLNKKVEYL